MIRHTKSMFYKQNAVSEHCNNNGMEVPKYLICSGNIMGESRLIPGIISLRNNFEYSTISDTVSVKVE